MTSLPPDPLEPGGIAAFGEGLRKADIGALPGRGHMITKDRQKFGGTP
jgi:hypothetical protein